jgi:hypothetical protein
VAQDLRVVVVGHPKLASVMTPVGRAVAERLCTGLDRDASIETIELGELTSAIHTWFEPTVVAAKETVLAADVLVVVSPVSTSIHRPGPLGAGRGWLACRGWRWRWLGRVDAVVVWGGVVCARW